MGSTPEPLTFPKPRLVTTEPFIKFAFHKVSNPRMVDRARFAYLKPPVATINYLIGA